MIDQLPPVYAPQQPVQHKRRMMIFALAGGLILISLVIIIGMIIRARFFTTPTSTPVQQELIEAQVKGVEVNCAQEQDPSRCVQQGKMRLANSLGIPDACEGLDKEAKDACIWLSVQTSAQVEVCSLIEKKETQTACEDSGYFKQAITNMDTQLCDKISRESTKRSCAQQVQDAREAGGVCEEGLEPEVCKEWQSVVAYEYAKVQTLDCATIVQPNLKMRCEERAQEVDADQDGLTNAQETTYGTDPLDTDSDDDTYRDGEEVANGYSPLGSGKLLE